MNLANQAGAARLSQSQILDRGVQLLSQLLPAAWAVELDGGPARSGAGDCLLTISAAGQAPLRTVVVARTAFTPRDVGAGLGATAPFVGQARTELPVTVVSPWFSQRTRTLLTEAGYNFVDLTGNIRISCSAPPVYIARVSGAKAGYPRQRNAAGVRGVKAGRIVRLLADVMPPYGIVELADAAGVTRGYASKVAEVLEREAVIERSARGGVASVDWRELLRLRARAYAVLEANAVTSYLSPNGPTFALECARDIGLQGAALTGSFAAASLAPVAASTALMLYVTRNEQELIDQARLLPADEGANVFLLRPYDEVVLERLYEPGPIRSRVPSVGCAQVALDCLTGLGRMPAEGEALMEWMAANEDRWRLPNLRAALNDRRV